MFVLKNKNGALDKSLNILIKVVAAITIIPIILIMAGVIYKGVSSISLEFIFQNPTNGMREGGIWPAIVGTVYLTIGTIIFSVPFGVMTAIYLVEYAHDNELTRFINIIIINLAGIPSIIFGLFGMALFVIYLKMGVSIIAGSLTLGIMCLPVIITSTKEALLAVPNSLREASLALGARKWETIKLIVLPASSSGILTGIILSISRAAGETAPIMFTAAAFYIPFLPISPFDQVMALPYHLYVLSTQVPNVPPHIIYGTLFVLMFITISFNLLGAYLRHRFDKR